MARMAEILTFSQSRALDALYRGEPHTPAAHVVRLLIRKGFLDQDHNLTPKGREVASSLRPQDGSTAAMRETIRQHRKRWDR